MAKREWLLIGMMGLASGLRAAHCAASGQAWWGAAFALLTGALLMTSTMLLVERRVGAR